MQVLFKSLTKGNTISNGYFFLYASLGIYSCYIAKSEKRFYLCHLTGMMVALGSMLFHATLKYEMQLLDGI